MGEWTLPALALILVAYAAVSRRLQSTPVSQAMVFTAVGLLLGNHILDAMEVGAASQYVRHLAEAALSLVLFTDAARINLVRLRRGAMVPIRLLGIGLPLTIAAGTVAGMAVLPGLSLWAAAALATILAPTDAALGEPVVSNPRLPSRIRLSLNVESGLNDGVCVPLLIIFVTLAVAEEGAAELSPVLVVLEEIGFGVLGGVLAGGLTGWVLKSFSRRGWVSRPWKQIIALVAPLLAYTSAAALGGSGFIAAFVCGIIFAALSEPHHEPATALAEQSGDVLNALTFLLFGAVLLGPALADLDWRIALYAVLSLTAVRMVPVAVALLGLGMRGVTVVFLGWFGPRGLASVVFVLLLVEESEMAERDLILTVVTLVVALSVFAHGMTALPGATRYANWYDASSRADRSMPESREFPGPRARGQTAGGTGDDLRDD